MTDIDIDAIRQREQAATDGPWKTGDRFGNRTLGSSAVVLAGNLPPIKLDPHRNGRNDAEFIAHARQDIPALLAKVDELTAERDEWRESYDLAHADRLARSLERDRTIDEREYLKGELAKATAALAKSREQAATYANEVGTLTAENARLRQDRDTKADIVKTRAVIINDLSQAIRRGAAFADGTTLTADEARTAAQFLDAYFRLCGDRLAADHAVRGIAAKLANAAEVATR